MRKFLIALTRNPISLLGSAITTAAAVVLLSLLALELTGFHGSPYLGILAYLVLPAIFVVGLLLIPIGIVRERRRERRARERGEQPARFPVLDLNRDRVRRAVLLVLALTLVNLVILSAATYKGVETMESTEFCGATCHTVMEPEYTAYKRSAHAEVACVECHIGPGADWFVKSKLSGAWQVVSATFDLYPTPVPSPIDNLRPARETCEQCHWPAKFVGDRLKVINHYQEDEANSVMKTVLLLRVGGVQGRNSHGIHWHVDPGIQIRYRADPDRMTIYDVEMTRADGTVKTYLPPEPPAEDAETEWRVMDCVDCHNRPSHVFHTPEDELDRAIAEGFIDPSLPFVSREGLRLLEASYGSSEAARSDIAQQLDTFYRDNYPEVAVSHGQEIGRAAEALGTAWTSNNFPAMNVTWGTYPNHLGHQNFPGCFRCHDEEHATAEGETISQDCFSACHNLLAMEEEDPAILAELMP